MSVESDQLRVPGARTSDEALPDAGLRIGVLGELVATREGTGLDLGGPRQRAVLALLVLARGDVVPADRLVDALWGDATPPSATSALQSYVSHLRKRMEPDRGPRDRQSVIARQGPGYALRVDDRRRRRVALRAAAAAGRPAARRRAGRRPAAARRGAGAVARTGVRRLRRRALGRRPRSPGWPGCGRWPASSCSTARLGQGETAVLVPEIEGLVAERPAARGAVAAARAGALPRAPAGRRAGRAAAGPHDPGRRARRRPRPGAARAGGRGARPVADAGRPGPRTAAATPEPARRPGPAGRPRRAAGAADRAVVGARPRAAGAARRPCRRRSTGRAGWPW